MDLCYVTLELTDADGVVCPLAVDTVKFSVKGPAVLAGVGNGDQMGMDGFTDDTHPLFYGKAVAILRSQPGTPGTARLTARVEGVSEVGVAIDCCAGE